MLVKQISVFLENKAGRLAEVTEILGNNNISIKALSIADTEDYGILRIIADDPEKGERVLKEAGFTTVFTDVVRIPIDDSPGGLAKVLKKLNEKEIPIEYMYAFVGQHEGQALVIFKVGNPDDVMQIINNEL